MGLLSHAVFTTPSRVCEKGTLKARLMKKISWKAEVHGYRLIHAHWTRQDKRKHAWWCPFQDPIKWWRQFGATTYLVLYGHLIWYLHLFVFLGFDQHLALQTPNCSEHINPWRGAELWFHSEVLNDNLLMMTNIIVQWAWAWWGPCTNWGRRLSLVTLSTICFPNHTFPMTFKLSRLMMLGIALKRFRKSPTCSCKVEIKNQEYDDLKQ